MRHAHAITTAAFAAAALPSCAREGQPVTVLEISVADLDLSSAVGRRVLDRRISAAAAELCATPRRPLDLIGKARCRRQTAAAARKTAAALPAGALALDVEARP